MKTIITGATGFIGRNIAETLHQKGHEVIATGRSEQIGQALQKQGITFKKADILDKENINKVFSSADCVIHCAAKTADWGSYREFFDTNVVGTRNVIAACRTYDIKKIIFISTPSVYYSGKDRFSILEDEPLPEKQFHYGKTKLIAEQDLLALTDEDFKIIIFRPRAVYGKYDNTIVPRILKLAEKKKLPLIGGGKALVDLTYIDNFVDAVLSCFSAPDSAWNEIYNISNGDPISLKEWFSMVLKVFNRPFIPKNIPVFMAKTLAGLSEFVSRFPFGNKKPQMTRFSVGYMSKSMTLSIEKAKQKLNYSPQIANFQGFKNYREWFDSQNN